MQTERGRTLWKFIQGSRVEIRKVIWPTRQETMQTALTVMCFALILGLFFWGLDFFLLWITRLLTGYGEASTWRLNGMSCTPIRTSRTR